MGGDRGADRRADTMNGLDKYKGDELKKFIIRLVGEKSEGVTVSYIVGLLTKACRVERGSKEYHTLRQRVYRAIKSLERSNFIKVERINSSRNLIIYPLLNCAKHVINLKIY